ncbi:MAG TPA: hypothetical protein DDY31_00155 [Lachnospiraceae bacterium]|nr:hypothetical protein [Lachnospiraceae bacterium]
MYGPDGQADVLKVLIEGAVGQTPDGIDIADANTLKITVSSPVPESGNVRPVKSAALRSQIAFDVLDSSGSSIKDHFIQGTVRRHVPAALWKSAPSNPLKEEGVVKDAVCGVELQVNTDAVMPELFPQSRYLSLEELYKKNTLAYADSFSFVREERLNLSEDDSVHIFSEGADSAKTIRNRQRFLYENGITENVSIAVFADNAENWLSENILIQKTL